MKSLSKFKQEPTVILEEEKTDFSKFDMLVRAGLANKSQIQRLHVILGKMQEERPVFNNTDRQIMQDLFNKMVDLVSNNKQLFQQTRRVVREEEELDEGVKPTSDYKIVTDANGNQRKVRAHRVHLTKNADEVQDVNEEILEEESRFDPPALLVLKRKIIRNFGNDTRIALYYNDKLKKYFSIPYSTQSDIDSPIQAESIEESVMDHLHKIVDSKSAKSVKFADGQTRKIDHYTASAITQVHKALNDENKKKISDMVHKSPEHFQKVANFAFSKTK